MSERISLRDANQRLARYIARVEHGQAFVITRRGKPVARLLPVAAERALTCEQEAALARTRERLARGYSLGGQRHDRDGLHDR